jgi:membrane-associated phospholipid phosphatase
MTGRRSVATLALCITLAPAALAPAALAQTPADTARLKKPLFVTSDLYILGMFSAATIAMFPIDKHLTSVLRDEDLVANRGLRRAASTFRFFGGPGPYLIGSGLYVIGRVGHVHRAAELALHGTEAVVVAQGVSGVMKLTLGRARPYTSADTNPRNFGFGRGLKGGAYQSFPSGHSTAAFAVAAAVSTETSAWWPHTRWIFGPILYGGATLVGLSRIYDDKHWASDVVMGAAVGTFTGLKTVRFNHTHEGNRIDRWLLGKSAASSFRLFGDGRSLGFAAHYAW